MRAKLVMVKFGLSPGLQFDMSGYDTPPKLQQTTALQFANSASGVCDAACLCLWPRVWGVKHFNI